MPINSFSVDMQTFNAISKNNDYFTSEFVINDTPIGARNLLTKGFIQDEISQFSGAAISTRGRFMSKVDHGKSPNDRPLYLFIQGPTKQCIDSAILKIDEIVRSEVGGALRQNFNRVNEPIQNETKLPPVTQVEKLFIGLDNLPASFDLRGKIIGQGGSNLHYIRSETGAAVTLRGRGSQFVDPQLGHEAPEPMHLFIEHTQSEGLVAARQLALNLIETLVQELQQVPETQQQQNMNIPTSQQILNLPPHIIGMPPLSIPPPQQQFATLPTVQQQAQNIEQPVILNNPSDQLQGQIQHIRNQQIQHVQQLGQPQQQVILQQPPPLARAPIVSIPPPGIHIPQHAGPMVPPPQIVQLSGPPPTVASSGSVLVVAPPPTQSIYLPSDLGSSSSGGTFSFLQGGVLYHQAPPIQTQAQIGDGLHIISAPSQGTVENVNISMSSHSQPPPQMIITQVQIEPNNQTGEQISHTFQQPVVSQHQKTQYQLIGHVPGTINQDQGNIQQSQSMIPSREIPSMENFTHFTINNATSVASSMVLTLPYHMTAAANTSCTTSIPVSQNPQLQLLTSVSQQQNIQMQHAEQENIIKQLPRQIMHTGFLPQQQRPRNDRGPITVQISSNQMPQNQPPNSQPPLEQIILTQPPNQTIINQMSHIPPNQILNQMPPGQLQNNNFIQANQVMVSQQELSHMPNNSQQLNQLPPIPTNQMPPNQMPMNQMPPNQMPPNQMPPNQMPPNQMPPNQMPPNQMPPNQMPPNQMPPNQMPPNQMPPNQIPPNQLCQIIKQEQINQQISLQPPMQAQMQRQGLNLQPFNQIPGYDHPPLRQENQIRNRLNHSGRNRKQGRNNRQNVYPWNKNDQDKSKYQHNDTQWVKREGERNFEFERKHDDFNNDGRPWFPQQANDNSQGEDNRKTQLRNNQDKDRSQYDIDLNKPNANNSISNNQNNQRNYQQFEKGDGMSHDTSNNWSRPEKTEIQHDDMSTDSGRKRKFEMDSNWNSRSDGGLKPSTSAESQTANHKSRFDSEDSIQADLGSQQKQGSNRAGSKNFGLNDQTKPDKETASKWSDQSGELSKPGDCKEKNKFEDAGQCESSDIVNKNDQVSNQAPNEMIRETHNEQTSSTISLNQKLTTSWCEQRSDFKGNVHYVTAGQFHGQNINEREKQFNPNFQPNFVNTVQMFQSNMPYLLPPPPPPPPHTQQQHNIQFNGSQGNNPHHITNAPPNIQMVSNIPQSMGQNMPMGQNVIPSINQNLPTIVSSISSHMVPNVPPMGPNMSNNMNQNVPFDMGQNIIGNIPQSMSNNGNQNISTNIQQSLPPVISQNVQSVSLPPSSMQLNIQPSSMGQILPSSMAQNVISNIGQTMPPNMTQSIIPNITQNMPPYMSQSMPTNMSQAVTHHIGQTVNMIGQCITSSANQAMPPNLNQNMPPIINQSIPPNMASNMSSIIGTNTTNVTHTLPMSIPNNVGQNISLNMQSVMGQMPMNVGPAMVPPPPNMMHGNVAQSVPNMVPPPVMPPNIVNSRPQMNHSTPQPQSMSMVPPPPPPPSIQTMSSQPPYPYWIG